MSQEYTHSETRDAFQQHRTSERASANGWWDGDPKERPGPDSMQGSRTNRFVWLTRLNAIAVNAARGLSRERAEELANAAVAVLPRPDRRKKRLTDGTFSLVRRLNARQMYAELPHLMRHEWEELADALDVDPNDVDVQLLSLRDDADIRFIHTYPDGTDAHRAFTEKVWSVEAPV